MGNALSEYQQVDADTVVIGAGPTGLGAAYRFVYMYVYLFFYLKKGIVKSLNISLQLLLL